MMTQVRHTPTHRGNVYSTAVINILLLVFILCCIIEMAIVRQICLTPMQVLDGSSVSSVRFVTVVASAHNHTKLEDYQYFVWLLF